MPAPWNGGRGGLGCSFGKPVRVQAREQTPSADGLTAAASKHIRGDDRTVAVVARDAPYEPESAATTHSVSGKTTVQQAPSGPKPSDAAAPNS